RGCSHTRRRSMDSIARALARRGPSLGGAPRSLPRRAPCERDVLLSDQRAQTIAEHSACGQTRTVPHDHDVLTVEPPLQFLDAIDVHDRRAMDAHERLWVELGFHVLHAFAKKMGLALRVDLHVVPRRLDPIDLLGTNEEDPAARLHYQPFGVLSLFA